MISHPNRRKVVTTNEHLQNAWKHHASWLHSILHVYNLDARFYTGDNRHVPTHLFQIKVQDLKKRNTDRFYIKLLN